MNDDIRKVTAALIHDPNWIAGALRVVRGQATAAEANANLDDAKAIARRVLGRELRVDEVLLVSAELETSLVRAIQSRGVS